MNGLRWKLSIAVWWFWLKVTPECAAKNAIIQAVRDAIIARIKGAA